MREIKKYMPENNINITAAKAAAKPKKVRAVNKKKINKSPFGLKDDFKVEPLMPAAGKIIKTEQLVSKTTELPARKNGQARNIYRKIAFSFVALTLILVAAVLYFSYAKLTIIIIPVQEKIVDSSTIEVLSSETAATRATLGPGQISGVVKRVPVEQTKEFSASGKEVLGEEVTGRVTIINNYIKNQPLVATTRLLSPDNKLFRLKNTVNVPAGGRVEAEIYADVAGRDMAIGPSKFTIPGLWAGLQDKIFAESKSALKYSQKVKYIIGQGDVDNAVSQLRSDLLANAKSQVSQAYSNYEQSIFAVDNNSVSQEVSAKVGEEKEKFSIKMKIMVTVVAFNDQEIYEQAKLRLAAGLADDKQITEFNRQDMFYTLENFDLSQGAARVKVDFSAKTILKDGAKVIKKNNLTGLDSEQLKIYLNNLPEVAGYEIKFFPAFLKKTPNLVDRIDIEIKK